MATAKKTIKKPVKTSSIQKSAPANPKRLFVIKAGESSSKTDVPGNVKKAKKCLREANSTDQLKLLSRERRCSAKQNLLY
jgi:hypothetical protein